MGFENFRNKQPEDRNEFKSALEMSVTEVSTDLELDNTQTKKLFQYLHELSGGKPDQITDAVIRNAASEIDSISVAAVQKVTESDEKAPDFPWGTVDPEEGRPDVKWGTIDPEKDRPT